MDWTLVINPGSSSKKYALYQGEEAKLTLAYEKTADGYALCVRRDREQQTCEDVPTLDYDQALLDVLVRIKTYIGDEGATITRCGVRVVAPGERFQTHGVIDHTYVEALTAATSQAPLHIPPILNEIIVARAALPDTQLVAVSDSAFHASIPPYRRRYSLRGTAEAGIIRYGYHGLSVGSVTRQARTLVSDAARLVVAHVGNGVSVTGVVNGQSCYNSMGYTPGSGLMMGSRAGDIDPGALISILAARELSGEAAHRFLQTAGGFEGWVGVKDLRVVLEREAQEDIAAHEAIESFLSALAEQIVSAATAGGGIDALILTGTAMERNAGLRSRLVRKLAWLGVYIHEENNNAPHSGAAIVSPEDSTAVVAVIPTDEMREMARIARMQVPHVEKA